jgi:long-chain acyl-CoA synthetase
LKAAGINNEGDLEQLAKNKQVKEYLLKELRSTGQKAGLKGPEILQDIIVSGELWTPEGGQLTAANKIQRKVIVKQFEKEIKVSIRLWSAREHYMAEISYICYSALPRNQETYGKS